jgi:hypothetical protein
MVHVLKLKKKTVLTLFVTPCPTLFIEHSAVEPYQTTNDGDGNGLWNAGLLKPPDAAVKSGRFDWKTPQSSIHRHIHNFTFVHFSVCLTSMHRLGVHICKDLHNFMNYLLISVEPTAVRSTGFQLVTIMAKSCLSPSQKFVFRCISK